MGPYTTIHKRGQGQLAQVLNYTMIITTLISRTMTPLINVSHHHFETF